MKALTEIRVADEAWVALAQLHRENPQKPSFAASEILARVKRNAPGDVRAGVQAHVYLHNVANVSPNSAQYRMFYKASDGTYRLFRPGDDSHPDRKEKTKPKLSDLPEEYHDLLAWYEQEYCSQGHSSRDNDPVLQMLGVGKELWTEESGDEFVARERRGWDAPPTAPNEKAGMAERVWQRLQRHQGDEFKTTTRLPFRYSLDGNGLWFERNGRRVNQRLSRRDLEKAVRRCPLDKTSDIADCRDYAYLFGLLTDRRIRGADW
jgi:hypothetical protein